MVVTIVVIIVVIIGERRLKGKGGVVGSRSRVIDSIGRGRFLVSRLLYLWLVFVDVFVCVGFC